jgi:hypothetical protein
MYTGPWKVDTVDEPCGLSKGNTLNLDGTELKVTANGSTSTWGTNLQDNGSDGTVDYNSIGHTLEETSSPHALKCTRGSGDGTVWTAVEGGSGFGSPEPPAS